MRNIWLDGSMRELLDQIIQNHFAKAPGARRKWGGGGRGVIGGPPAAPTIMLLFPLLVVQPSDPHTVQGIN